MKTTVCPKYFVNDCSTLTDDCYLACNCLIAEDILIKCKEANVFYHYCCYLYPYDHFHVHSH